MDAPALPLRSKEVELEVGLEALEEGEEEEEGEREVGEHCKDFRLNMSAAEMGRELLMCSQLEPVENNDDL